MYTCRYLGTCRPHSVACLLHSRLCSRQVADGWFRVLAEEDGRSRFVAHTDPVSTHTHTPHTHTHTHHTHTHTHTPFSASLSSWSRPAANMSSQCRSPTYQCESARRPLPLLPVLDGVCCPWPGERTRYKFWKELVSSARASYTTQGAKAGIVSSGLPCIFLLLSISHAPP